MPMIEELYNKKKEWAPVDLIREVGLKLNNENSILYNAAKNGIPVFVPVDIISAGNERNVVSSDVNSSFKI